MESLHDSLGGLTQVIADLKAEPELSLFSEVDISQAVRGVLRTLGWAVDNRREVKQEYRVGGRMVDYALFIDGAEQVFIELKRGGEPLEQHQEQLLDYAFKQGIRLALLTNGTEWWFYLPIKAGNWEQRKFSIISLDEQEEAEIAHVLAAVLGKENVNSGDAFDSAEDLHRQTQRQNLILETMPEAWNQLIDEGDELIVARLAEKTGELCEDEPDENEVKAFLSAHRQDMRIPSPASSEPVIVDNSDTHDSVKRKQIRAFTFNGRRKEVSKWSDYYIAFCEMLCQIDKDLFETVLAIRGRGGAIFFSRNEGNLREPALIPGSDIYVEKNLDANSIHTRVGQVAEKLGYPKPTVETDPP